MADKKPIHTLSLRLLRKSWKVEQTITQKFGPDGDQPLTERPWPSIDGARLFVGQIYETTPPWLKFLQAYSTGVPDGLFGGGAGAVLFVPAASRVVAVCFGYIHLALNDDAFERQFGLKVTLNTVPRGSLRTLDVATPDAVTFQKRVQASKDSDLEQFGVDKLRDLARVAGGTPTKRSFAHFVAGKDALSITCELAAEDLQSKCVEAVQAFRGKTYQNDYPWIDNMRIVTEKDDLTKLDQALFKAIEALRQGQNSDLHMAPPEVVDYTEGAALHYNGFGSYGTNFHSLSIQDYISELNEHNFSGDIQDVKEKHRIKAQGKSGTFTEKWRVYDCFVFEATLGSGNAAKHYILFAGEWYRVSKKFKDQVESFFNSVERVKIVGATTCRNEQQLIEHLHTSRTDLLKLDRTRLNPSGVTDAAIEVCDFLSKKKEFVHLKDGHSSDPISHLWSQGVVSAVTFVSDEGFRKGFRDLVKKLDDDFSPLLPKKAERVARETYKVVYGIMRKPYADGSLDVPFFSKLSFQAAAMRIGEIGIPIAIELIEKPAADKTA